MSDPVLRIHFPIKSRILDENVGVGCVEVDVADCGRLVGDGVCYRYGREEWWNDNCGKGIRRLVHGIIEGFNRVGLQ
jgi:hypothetical protein